MEETDFSPEDYMNGKPLPIEELPPPIKRTRKYFYGVFKTRPGKLANFICRDTTPEGLARWRTECDLDGSVILVEKFIEAEPKNILTIATELLEEVRRATPALSAPAESTDIKPGSVVTHYDGTGMHTAIVLRKGLTTSLLIFATTNPEWNPRARPITTEECALMGFPMKKHRTTYFAPVVRDNYDLIATELVFPQHRVQELLEEFSSYRQRQ